MTLNSLLILQLIAHFTSDFLFQTNKIAEEKNSKSWKTKYLYIHVLITISFSFLFSLQWEFWYASLIIGIAHFVIDALKSLLIQRKIAVKYLFYIDQVLHVLIIILIVKLFLVHHKIHMLYTIDTKILLLILAFLITSKPANILIKEIFNTYEIKLNNTGDLINAGKLIGNIERWLILVFILIGQVGAVGFLLASKSILRYGDKNNDQSNKTEYVLIGTMLSFGIAIVVGVMIKKIVLK